MEARLITVRSAAVSPEKELYAEGSQQPAEQRKGSITMSKIHPARSSGLESPIHDHQTDSCPAGDSGPKPCSDRASIFITEQPVSNGQHVKLADLTKTECLALHSTSTTLAEEEGEGCNSVVFERVSPILDWFEETLNQVCKNGSVTVKDLKQAAKECEVIIYYEHLLVQQYSRVILVHLPSSGVAPGVWLGGEVTTCMCLDASVLTLMRSFTPCNSVNYIIIII